MRKVLQAHISLLKRLSRGGSDSPVKVPRLQRAPPGAKVLLRPRESSLPILQWTTIYIAPVPALWKTHQSSDSAITLPQRNSLYDMCSSCLDTLPSRCAQIHRYIRRWNQHHSSHLCKETIARADRTPLAWYQDPQAVWSGLKDLLWPPHGVLLTALRSSLWNHFCSPPC